MHIDSEGDTFEKRYKQLFCRFSLHTQMHGAKTISPLTLLLTLALTHNPQPPAWPPFSTAHSHVEPTL